MKKSNAIEKLFVSMINTGAVVVLASPLFLLWGWTAQFKASLVLLFFLLQLLAIVTPRHRSLGMIAMNSEWGIHYPLRNHFTFAILYTLSFSTLVVWVYFPFDLLLINLLLVQLPLIQKTGYTLHGYLSGKMVGHRKQKTLNGSL